MTAAVPVTRPAELRTLLRGLGQIVLQANAATGACLLAALALANLRAAAAALMGAAAANIVGLLAGGDRDDARQGLHGFNGALAALAAVSFVRDASTAFGLALLAATAAGLLYGPFAGRLRRRALCCYSSPCLAATALWLPLVPAAPATGGPAPWTLASGFGGSVAALAQIAFARGVLSGALVLAGIAISSRRDALYALGGALAGSALLVAAGAGGAALHAGLLGFNGALTAIALAGYGLAIALPGVLAAALLQLLAMHAGVTSLTTPFVLATWLMLAARSPFTGAADVVHPSR
ncbi:urea transporter [Burkholderia alba]|uniref:urea transporter n=1 Tax=Burkholderia alba TaxID=2683677 RepID=UPI002B053253|nr:urea transporter [Burkholderia alba]